MCYWNILYFKSNLFSNKKLSNICHQFLSEYWSQNHTQNGNIHSAKLDVYAEKQSLSNLSFINNKYK